MALVSINKPGAATLIVAITLPEIPRVVRVVRSVVLSVREQTYVEAAIAVGTRPQAANTTAAAGTNSHTAGRRASRSR